MVASPLPCAIAVGLGDDVGKRDGPPLAFVTIQEGGGAAVHHLDQFRGQTEGVMDAAIHAHAAFRAVEVGGVAGNKQTAQPVYIGDALVDLVHPAGAHVADLREV